MLKRRVAARSVEVLLITMRLLTRTAPRLKIIPRKGQKRGENAVVGQRHSRVERVYLVPINAGQDAKHAVAQGVAS